MEIRRLTEADRLAFAAIRLELFPDAELGDWAVEHHLSPGAVAFGAFDPELIGYAAADFRSHAEGAWEQPPGEQHIAYLEEWYVREGHRRQGVGLALLDAVRDWARQHRATHLASDSDPDNATAIAAHLAAGFAEVERAVHFVERLERDQAPPDLPDADAITLRELDHKRGTDMMRLNVGPAQRQFVATNLNSLARAYLSEHEVWVRGIYAGEVPVGFAMVSLADDRTSLWRFMIDHRYQRHGYGKQAMELIIDHIRRLGVDRFYTSYVPTAGGPAAFYESLGFVETGERDEWEVEAVLEL